MGEYADDCIDAGMYQSPHPFGHRVRRSAQAQSFDNYEYKRIVVETPKAYLFEMSGGAQHWIPKSLCVVHKDKTVSIFTWFCQQLMFGKNEEFSPEVWGNESCECDQEDEY